MIDFAIIGAQKSGTTAIYRYLKEHPEISLPVNKEASYFLEENTVFDRFFHDFYEEKRNAVGSVSPQYMCYSGVPKIMKAHNENIKLIAILREPIDRALSHHNMNVRRGYVHDNFDNIKKILTSKIDSTLPNRADKSEQLHEVENVFRWGLYGTILNEYLKYFEKKNILVIDYSELRDKPEQVFENICKHINVDTDFNPKNLGRKYHKGGTETILPRADYFKKFRFAKWLWHTLPKKTREKVGYWYEVTNVKSKKSTTQDVFVKDDCLVNLYREDLQGCELTKHLVSKWY
ncbi:sulfotransferase domain-containing protein [Thalassotalea aquiviva]|uniref:sulfotransferase domain-containing protein n=1 Tax=Thalassotalea aquiviva TaxID=3242415 RepID=UPI00352B24F4